MQKITILIVLIALAAMPVLAQETKLSGEFWGRWTMENGKVPADSTNATLKNYFALERGYLGFETKFSESTKARFTIDLFSTDMLEDGAGLKLKYGYVDFANMTPIPDLTLSAGLQKVYFGTIYDWNYALIGKAPSDEYKIANSADYGITANGYIPNGKGEYAVGIYNGEGYKKFGKNLKDNTSFAYLANLRLTPVPGITIGGSFMTNSVEREELLATNAVNDKYQDQTLIDGLARFAYGPLDLWAEYLIKDVKHADNFSSKDYSAKGLMIMPCLNLQNLTGYDVQVLARYDSWDESERTDSNKNKLIAITGGINYNFMHDEHMSPKMNLQLNVTNKTYDEDNSASAYKNGLKDVTQVMMQLKWRFANTLK